MTCTWKVAGLAWLLKPRFWGTGPYQIQSCLFSWLLGSWHLVNSIALGKHILLSARKGKFIPGSSSWGDSCPQVWFGLEYHQGSNLSLNSSFSETACFSLFSEGRHTGCRSHCSSCRFPRDSHVISTWFWRLFRNRPLKLFEVLLCLSLLKRLPFS